MAFTEEQITAAFLRWEQDCAPTPGRSCHANRSTKTPPSVWPQPTLRPSFATCSWRVRCRCEQD